MVGTRGLEFGLVLSGEGFNSQLVYCEPHSDTTSLGMPYRVTCAFSFLRWLNTVLAVYEYMSFAKLQQEKGRSSQAETWHMKNILMKDFD